ncbi:MAG TPA: sigma-70 family RNA polymerase sigma factor, partial [Ignavibacteriaceae bacterium]
EELLQLIEQNKGIILKICHTYCKDPGDREDLTQEIIYQLWKSWKRFDNTYKFSTWMYRVGLNTAIAFYRKEKNKESLIPLTEQHEEVADITDGNRKSEEQLQLLQKFIYQLKDLDKALMLLYLDSKSYSEIGDILGITETNVATKISRIKEKLKQNFSAVNK